MDEDIDNKIDQQLDKSEKVGAETAAAIQGQGEQLKKVKEKQEKMESDLKYTEKNLNILDQCCCCLLFTKPPKKPVTPIPTAVEDQIIRDTPRNAQIRSNPVKTTGNIDRVTDDAREDEMDENVGYLSNF
ncbi:hypothetical protein HZS_68 [Henneguya salminicola]|nr:hypothetical protein HZS_68 [Henneguya salminicola]